MIMVSDEVKRAYVERTKAANYQASLLLEGFAGRKIYGGVAVGKCIIEALEKGLIRTKLYYG